MEEGKGIKIFGRACRTEMLKATRKIPFSSRGITWRLTNLGSFLISKYNGDDITVFEARNIMGCFGEISKCDRLYQHNPEGARLPPSIIVELSKFSDNKLNIEAVSILSEFP